MDEGAREANKEMRESKRQRELLERLDRIIHLLEILTDKGNSKFAGKLICQT